MKRERRAGSQAKAKLKPGARAGGQVPRHGSFTISAYDCAVISRHHQAAGGGDPTFPPSALLQLSRSNMRATDTIRGRKASAAGRAGDVRRAILAGGFLLAVCVSAIVFAGWFRESLNPESRSPATRQAELSKGSMLVVSPTGELCRESIIDNSTGQVRNNGWVNCEQALAKAANPGADGRPQGSRLDIIREGFRGRQ